MKTITIKVSNNEVDALEDIILTELSDEEFAKKHKLAIRIWQKIVREVDKGLYPTRR